jgi:hypothetical protein
MECLGLHNKPKAEVHPGHKLTGPKEEKEEKEEEEEVINRKQITVPKHHMMLITPKLACILELLRFSKT